MPQFIPVLIAACVMFAALYAFVNTDFSDFKVAAQKAPAPSAVKAVPAPKVVSPALFSPTALATANPVQNSRSIELIADDTIGGSGPELISFAGTVRQGLRGTDADNFTFSSKRYDRAFLYFTVNDTNNYGQFVAELNGGEVYRGYPVEGEPYRVEFDASLLNSTNRLSVKSGSPNWMVWTESSYTYNGRIVGNTGKTAAYYFRLDSAKNTKIMAEISEAWGNVTLKVNGEPVWYGHSDFVNVRLRDGLLVKDNKLEVVPDPNAKVIIDWLDIFYE